MKKTIFIIVAILIAWIAFSVIFWKTQLMWIVPIVPIGLTIYHCAKKGYRRHVYLSRLKENPLIYIAAILALVSTVLQYWQQVSNALYRFTNSQAPLWIAGIFSTFLIVGITLVCVRDYREKKVEKRKEKVRLAQVQLEKEEREKKKEEGLRMLQALEGEPSVLWIDLLKVMENRVYIPDEMALSADLLSLIQVSDVKNQIFFNPDLVKGALNAIHRAADRCHNDEYLIKAKEQLQRLKTLESYTGYDQLMKIVKADGRIPEYLLEKSPRLNVVQ